ncbi:hypothetical protein MMC22_007791 [Lobaria immixta]|nr:hypothetical protein [Lobaria immixta]
MFYSCRLTAAASLAVSLAKRDDSDPIQCPSNFPAYIPPGLAPFPSLTHMCASKLRFRRNMECVCLGGRQLRCGRTSRPDIQSVVSYCLNRCTCGFGTRRNYLKYTEELDDPKDVTVASGNPRIIPTGNSVEEGASYSLKPNPSRQYECAKTCTSVDHGCPLFSAGFCKCYAPPATAEFWHTGNCGLVPHIGFPVHTVTGSHGRRSYNLDLAQQRHSYYLNATAHFAFPNGATALPGPPPELHVQLASGMLPSPCNASYVSFACGDSPDGIVHEPPENWLGALLPEGAKELPPVPKEFLKIRKL